MRRRDFLKASGAAALASELGAPTAGACIPGHNFDKYDFGSGPPVTHRLYQGPFPTDLFPSWNVAMATTPSNGTWLPDGPHHVYLRQSRPPSKSWIPMVKLGQWKNRDRREAS